VPAALVGALLTWLALVADSLWPPVLMHFLFNAATLTGRHLAARGDMAEQSVAQMAITIALAAIALPLGILWVRTNARTHEQE
jgi:membrane protease YdiL (CAAX protease family)